MRSPSSCSEPPERRAHFPVRRAHRAALVALAAAWAFAWPAHAQGRFRVLVPDLEPEAGAGAGFGEHVADRLRALIDDMDTHASVETREVREALKRHGLDEDELGCIEWRQLAVQMGVEIVFCGSYAEAGGVRTVHATFQGARSGDPFEVPEFTARDADRAAEFIRGEFRDYVEQLRAASICVEYVGSGQWTRAIEACEAALALNPTMVSALYARGRARLGLAESGAGAAEPAGRERDELVRQALADFDAVLERNPAHEDALQSAGYAATLLGERQRALAYYRRLLQFDPTNTDIRIRLALELANNGDPMDALALAEEGIPYAPDDPTLERYAGHFATAAAQRLETGGAARDAGAAGAAGDTAPAAPADSTTRAEAVALFAKAAAYYDSVYAVAPDSVDALTIRNMLIAYPRIGRAAEAVGIGREALSRFPDDAPLRIALAGLLEREDDLEGAIALIDQARGIDEAAARFDVLVGSWLLKRGRVEDAAARFRRAVDAGQASGDDIARLLFAQAINGPYKDRRWSDAAPLLERAAEWAGSDQLAARIHFFAGYSLFQWGIATEDGETAAAARRALPLFQRALDHLSRGRGAPEATRVDELIGAARQYVDIQEALIRRGR